MYLISQTFFGHIPEYFRNFPGHFREMSRTCPGNFLDISGKFPGNVKEARFLEITRLSIIVPPRDAY